MKQIIVEHEREWDTEQVIRIEGDLFYRVVNGGRSGSRDRQQGDGTWDKSAIECQEVSLSEARRIMLGFGMEPNSVYEATAG